MKDDNNFLSLWIKRFLLEYLISIRNLSKNTSKNRLIAFKLLFKNQLQIERINKKLNTKSYSQ